MLSEYHPYLWHPSPGLKKGNGQEDQCFDAHVFMCDAPAAFSYVFFFIDGAWGSQVFQDFPSLSFCAGLDQLATSPSSNGNYVECSVGRLAFAAGHMKANGWRSTELLASFVSSWQSLSSHSVVIEPGLVLILAFQMWTLTHIKLFLDVLNEIDIAACAYPLL